MLERTSYRHFKTTKYANDLYKKLVSQKWKCVYSGFPLKLGINAELDHIVPKYLGGKNTINNVQWVDSSINKLKGIFPEKKLLEIVEAIYINLKSVL